MRENQIVVGEDERMQFCHKIVRVTLGRVFSVWLFFCSVGTQMGIKISLENITFLASLLYFNKMLIKM